MPYDHTCTSCGHADAIEGVLSQSTLEGRLETKNNEIGLLKTDLSAANGKAGNYDAVVLERDTLKTTIAGLEQATARSALYAQHGIGAGLDGEQATRVRSTFETIFASETTGVEDAPTYGAWLESDAGAKAHPLLSGAYGTPGAPSAPVPMAPPTSGPSADAGARPGVNGSPNASMSKAGVAAHFQGAAYQGKSTADRRAEFQRMRADARAPTTPAPT